MSRQQGPFFPYPIGIVAFNRPEYLAKVTTQLLEQTRPADASSVYVMVDGFDGSLDQARSHPDRRADNRSILQQRMPTAQVREHAKNQGVAASIFELEQWMFQETTADWVVVVEEDIDQAAEHLEQLLRLIERLRDTAEVGMVSATGETAIEPWRGPDALYPAVGSRAYAISRAYFERKRPFMEAYLKVISGRRYDQLEYPDVAGPLADLGVLALAPNQDFVAFALLQRLDTLYVTTGRRHVRHVGVRGMHFQGSGPVDHPLFATSTAKGAETPYSTPQFVFRSAGPDALDDELGHVRAESRAAFAREAAHRLLAMHAHPEDYLRMSAMLQRIPRRLLLAARRRSQMLRAQIDIRLQRFR